MGEISSYKISYVYPISNGSGASFNVYRNTLREAKEFMQYISIHDATSIHCVNTLTFEDFSLVRYVIFYSDYNLDKRFRKQGTTIYGYMNRKEYLKETIKGHIIDSFKDKGYQDISFFFLDEKKYAERVKREKAKKSEINTIKSYPSSAWEIE